VNFFFNTTYILMYIIGYLYLSRHRNVYWISKLWGIKTHCHLLLDLLLCLTIDIHRSSGCGRGLQHSIF